MGLAFWGGRWIVAYVYTLTKRPLKEVDTFSIWILLSALLGARLGEVLFYHPHYYLTHPVEALLPVRFFPQFRIVGYTGLSYHGALIGSALGAYGYLNYKLKCEFPPFRIKIVRTRRKRQSFLWLSTPLALALMMGFLVRVGNFINAEIIGTPTKHRLGVLFAHEVKSVLKQTSPLITDVAIHKSPKEATTYQDYVPITICITLKNIGLPTQTIEDFIHQYIKPYLAYHKSIAKHIHEAPESLLNYTLTTQPQGNPVIQITTKGIPRHPVQLYEGLGYLLALIIHLYWWQRKHHVLKDGVIAGSAMIVCYGLRFILEFFKDSFNVLLSGPVVTLTTGHLLSLLTVLSGVLLIRQSQRLNKQ